MNRIGWIQQSHGGDQWGDPAALQLPSDGRGLLLAEGVFETVLVLSGRAQWLDAHLRRWSEGAALLGLAAPPGLAPVQALLDEAIERSGIGTGALRLNWCRGSGSRGLQAPEPAQDDPGGYLFWLQFSAATPCFEPVRVIVSPTELRQATSVLSRCKSFGYGSALIARRQAIAAGADDALLLSSTGTLCCGSSANLLVQRGDRWLTPPITSGCLPGIMRQRGLELGLLEEASLSSAELEQSGSAVLINSLGCRPIAAINQMLLQPERHELLSWQAQQLWQALLESTPPSSQADQKQPWVEMR